VLAILTRLHQVRTIDACLKLHYLLCPPEFSPFHDTLEKFFKKNFRDEIRRLLVDEVDSITDITGPSSHIGYPSSGYEASVKRSISSSSTARYGIPPIQVGQRFAMTPPPESPTSPGGASSIAHTHHTLPQSASSSSKQTPLKRHLAHLARHGFHGVSSAPGDSAGGSDSLSAESPHNSFVNVGNGNGINGGTPGAQMSGASVATSYMGSIGSFGSIKGRFSRFGSLSFSRRGANS